MARTHRPGRGIHPSAAACVSVAVAGLLLIGGCTDAGDPADDAASPTPTASADAGTSSPEPTVTREPGPPTEAELATCSTLAQVLPDATKLVQALGDGQPVDPALLDRVKQGDESLAGMAPENMQPLVTSFSEIVTGLDALRSGTDTDGASLDTGQYLRAVGAFLDYCLDDVGYVPASATPMPTP